MNQNQKYVLIGVVVVLLLQLVFFTPLTVTFEGNTYNYTDNFFYHGDRLAVDVPRFLLYWGIIAIFGGIAFYIAKDDKDKEKD